MIRDLEIRDRTSKQMISNKRDRKKRIMFVDVISRELFVDHFRSHQDENKLFPCFPVNLCRSTMWTMVLFRVDQHNRRLSARIYLPTLTAIITIDFQIQSFSLPSLRRIVVSVYQAIESIRRRVDRMIVFIREGRPDLSRPFIGLVTIILKLSRRLWRPFRINYDLPML